MEIDINQFYGSIEIEYLDDKEKMRFYLPKDKDMPIVKNIIGLKKGEIGEFKTEKGAVSCKFIVTDDSKLERRIIKKSKSNVIYNKKMLINHIRYKSQYKYTGFFHFTDCKTLESIFNSRGLYSRQLLNERNITFQDNANTEIIEKTRSGIKECVRLHFRPQTADFYKAKMIDPCYLIIDYSILYENRMIYMTNKVAASHDCIRTSVNYSKSIGYIINSYNFDIIFNKRYDEANKQIQMAEILVKDFVNIKYIKKIVFKTEKDKQNFNKMCYNWNVETVVRPDIFEKNLG